MFLQVMSFTGNISDRRLPRAQLDSSDFSNGRIRFLGFGRVDFGTDCFFLETLIEERRFGEFWELLSGSSGDCEVGARESGQGTR
jgi:hypothetical protein